VQIGGAVPHVELSLTEDPSRLAAHGNGAAVAARAPRARTSYEAVHVGSLERWASVVAGAAEPSLVLDADTVIIAASASCAEMIGLDNPVEAVGLRLRDAGVRLVDFTGSLDELDPGEADKIPPVLAISSRRLARGLMRVACPITKNTCTMDAIATPLWDGATVVGSLTFFSQI
jgi:PAS domain-containing protein